MTGKLPERLRVERDEARELAALQSRPDVATELLQFAELMEEAAVEIEAQQACVAAIVSKLAMHSSVANILVHGRVSKNVVDELVAGMERMVKESGVKLVPR